MVGALVAFMLAIVAYVISFYHGDKGASQAVLATAVFVMAVSLAWYHDKKEEEEKKRNGDSR